MVDTAFRPLHWVLRVSDRAATMRFFVDNLGLLVLRHEEFAEGCDAACNGPYDGKWSKTMIGYAPEADSFALEITYNYTHPEPYKKGNDLVHIELTVPVATIDRLRKSPFRTIDADNGELLAQSPEGYQFLLVPRASKKDPPRISGVRLRAKDARRTLRFYAQLLGMVENDARHVRARAEYATPPFALELDELVGAVTQVDYAHAGGRLAIAVADPAPFEKEVITVGGKVHTPLVELHTPGKASVKVVILQDPDGGEVCVVNEDGFSDLSQVDPEALAALKKAIDEDKSKEIPAWKPPIVDDMEVPKTI